MSFTVLSFIIDIVVLVFLIITMYYAIRLSKSLKNFRIQRKELKGLIRQLSDNIDEAQNAMEGMKVMAQHSGQDLQKSVNDARAMIDELQLMTQSGDSLAQRLEGLAEKARETNQGAAGKTVQENYEFEKPYREIKQEDTPSFAIQDKEYEEEVKEDSLWQEDDGSMPADLQSQAEKDLFMALKKNRKKSSGER